MADKARPTRPIFGNDKKEPRERTPTVDISSKKKTDQGKRRETRIITGTGESGEDGVSAKPRVNASENGPTVGWVVVVKGPGKGKSCSIYNGNNSVGRGDDQRICLDFGDDTISRDKHAFIAFDDESRKFYAGQAGQANLVRLNNVPLLNTEEIKEGDQIRLGETTLAFVPFCGPAFGWEDS